MFVTWSGFAEAGQRGPITAESKGYERLEAATAAATGPRGQDGWAGASQLGRAWLPDVAARENPDGYSLLWAMCRVPGRHAQKARAALYPVRRRYGVVVHQGFHSAYGVRSTE
ncbi:hypothetical protein UVI_02016360 [Ustilaginoidea virens]|uniref:Uncharacterized protein n=1 Tax=Ustilaginoidea virens TaxID=1159556 RepID=A0A1B5KRR6_USTVR|nr:hypothetical protein UVI_02016360 [Ustilaginoidea virens]